MATPGWANTTRLGLDIGVNNKRGERLDPPVLRAPQSTGLLACAVMASRDGAGWLAHYVCAGSATCASSSTVV